MSAAATLLLWAAASATTNKLAPDLGKEISAAVVAVDKALGLESWPSHGAKPCVNRGGPDDLTKQVSPEEARRCASAAVGKGFPRLGKSYVLAVLMAAIGPSTVIAIGVGDAAGWAAYSCDPTRKACPPMRLTPANKWGKRLVDRQAQACKEAGTIWLPAGRKACEAP